MTDLGHNSLEYREDNARWSAEERAILSGMVRERAIHGKTAPRFGYTHHREAYPELDYPEDVLRAAPRSFSEQADRTLQNLASMGGRGEWINLNWETDVSVAYAKDHDELGVVLGYLEREEGCLDRAGETMYDTMIRVNGRGLRRVQDIGAPRLAGDAHRISTNDQVQRAAEHESGRIARVPTAFISYSWDSEAHKAWTKSLAARLRGDGIDTKLDQWETAPGDQLPQFMERSIRDNDFVLMICTPNYKAKADGRKGGVGYEGDIITGELYANPNHRRFIPVLREGDWDNSLPSWMRGKWGVDLRGEPYSEEQYRILKETLRGEREQPPPVGSAPAHGH